MAFLPKASVTSKPKKEVEVEHARGTLFNRLKDEMIDAEPPDAGVNLQARYKENLNQSSIADVI